MHAWTISVRYVARMLDTGYFTSNFATDKSPVELRAIMLFTKTHTRKHARKQTCTHMSTLTYAYKHLHT